jgi:CheY-like chemotaxis protein
MPEVSGLDSLLHVSRSAPELPVVAVTATDVERIEGAAAVLQKPVDLPTLSERLAAVAARRPGTPAAPAP